MNTIGIIHLNQIGDLVFSLPLLKALRNNFPQAEIHSIVKPNLKELLSGSAYVDHILPRGSGLSAHLELIRTLRRNRYDLLICLARSEEGFMLTALSKAVIKAGFTHFPWDLFLDVKETIEGHNCWYNNAKLLRKLDVEITQDNYVGLLPIDGEERTRTLPDRYVVISPGASRRRLIKAWDEEKFAELIILLHAQYALAPLLVGGKDTEECNAMIIRQVRGDDRGGRMGIVDLSGKIGLQELVSILRGATLFVGIDSGVMHLASAVDIPVVCLFGPTDPFYVGPQNEKSMVVRHEMECAPCYVKPSCTDYACMRKLDVARVMEACTLLLADTAR